MRFKSGDVLIYFLFALGNGTIEFPQFVNKMEKQKKSDEKEAYTKLAFRVFDANNKGYIESAELRFIILNMDSRIPRDELNEMISSVNLDQDRRVTYQGKATNIIVIRIYLILLLAVFH